MDREIITFAEAMSAGLKRYFTGKPCRNGHIVERQCGDRNCVECARECEARSHAANREKRLKIYQKKNQRRFASDPEKRRLEWREDARQRREDNPEKMKEIKRRSDRKRKSDKIIAAAERAKTNGAVLDMKDAIDIFKTHDNAFDFVETTELEFKW